MTRHTNRLVNTEVEEQHPEWTRDRDPDAIVRQQERGLEQLLAGEVLPTKLGSGIDEDLLASLGFTLGVPVHRDPLFRHARLPRGWSKRRTGRSHWLEIVDEAGWVWFELFYKAAFYDRQSLMKLPDPEVAA